MYPIMPAALQAAFLAFDTSFHAVLETTPIYWPKFATKKESKTEVEHYPWLDTMPQVRQWTGTRKPHNLSARDQVITNLLWEDSFSVKRSKLEDDQYGIYMPAVQELARQSALWPDNLIATAMLNGTLNLGYDNQPIYSANHPTNPDDPASSVQSNLFTSATSGPMPLTADNVAAVWSAMSLLVTKDGIPLEVVPDTLVVPPQLKYQADKIIHSTLIAGSVAAGGGGPGGAVAASNVLQGMLKVEVFPRLGIFDASSWYLVCTTRAVKPFIFQERFAPEFTYLNRPDDPNVFQKDEYSFGVRMRGNAGYGQYFLSAKAGL